MSAKRQLHRILLCAAVMALCGVVGHAREFTYPELMLSTCPLLATKGVAMLKLRTFTTEEEPCHCQCSLTPDDIMRELPKTGHIPYLMEIFHNNVSIGFETVVDRLEARPGEVSSLGLRHCHFRATVYAKRTTRWNLPWPVTFTRPLQKVIYFHKYYPVEVEPDPVTGAPRARGPHEE